MGTEIKDIVQVSITRETAKITRVGFGTPMILGVHSAFTERIRSYASITAVAVDFATTSDEYRMANILFSQQLSPATIKIGRREVSAAVEVIVTVAVVADNTDYTLIANGQSFTIDSGTSSSAILIAAALKTAFDASFNNF